MGTRSPRTVKKDKDFQKRLSLSATDQNHDETSIRDNLILTALNAALEHVDSAISVPKALEQNKFIWAKAMFKRKALQEIISNFTGQINRYIAGELRSNWADVEKQMKLTRPPDQSLHSARQYIDQIYDKLGGGLRDRMAWARAKRPRDSTVSSDSDRKSQLETKDDDKPKTVYDLARMVKNRSHLLHVVLNYVVPKNLEPALRPSEQWIIEMCNSKELLSFSHKKQAIEEIKDSIMKEIERRRQHQKLAANLHIINGHLSALDSTTATVQRENEGGKGKEEREH